MTHKQAALILYGGIVVVGIVGSKVIQALDARATRRMRKQTENVLVQTAETILYCHNVTDPARFGTSMDFLDQFNPEK